MALHFLKSYSTENINVGLFKADAKTHRKWQWEYVELISSLEIVRISAYDSVKFLMEFLCI